MPKRRVVVVPDDDILRQKRHWQTTGTDSYVAVRHFILIVESTSDERKRGPAFSTFGWPTGAKLNLEKKRVRTTKSTEQLVRGIETTVSTKLSREVTSSINAIASLGADALGATFNSGMTTKAGTEFAESLKSTVTGTATFEIADTEEDSQAFEHVLPASGGTETVVNKYFRLRAKHWDVFLVRTELLALRYRRTWALTKIRETIREWSAEPNLPLGRITFYQPEPDYGVIYGEYTPEIGEDALIEVTSAVASAPKHVALEEVTPLATYARTVFQTTGDWAKGVVRRVFKPARKPRPRASTSNVRRAAPAKKAITKKVSRERAAGGKVTDRSSAARSKSASSRTTSARKGASSKHRSPARKTSKRRGPLG